MKLMQNKKTKELVAAKWIPRTLGHGLPKNVEREIVNHRKLLHPNIIRFKEVRTVVQGTAAEVRQTSVQTLSCQASWLECAYVPVFCQPAVAACPQSAIRMQPHHPAPARLLPVHEGSCLGQCQSPM